MNSLRACGLAAKAFAVTAAADRVMAAAVASGIGFSVVAASVMRLTSSMATGFFGRHSLLQIDGVTHGR